MPTIIEIPSDLLSAVNIRFVIGRRHLTSPQPFTAHLRASGPTDERWIAEMTLPTMARDDLDRLQALFDLGDGLAGFFSAFDCVHAYPRGTGTGLSATGAGVPFSDGSLFSDGATFDSGVAYAAVASAAARGAEYLALSGLIADQAVGLARGDQFAVTLGGEGYGLLHHAVADAATDASGNATVRIRPRLRAAVTAGQQVNFLRPRGVFRLTEESAMTFSRGPGGLADPTLSLVECPEALTCAI